MLLVRERYPDAPAPVMERLWTEKGFEAKREDMDGLLSQLRGTAEEEMEVGGMSASPSDNKLNTKDKQVDLNAAHAHAHATPSAASGDETTSQPLTNTTRRSEEDRWTEIVGSELEPRESGEWL